MKLAVQNRCLEWEYANLAGAYSELREYCERIEVKPKQTMETWRSVVNLQHTTAVLFHCIWPYQPLF